MKTGACEFSIWDDQERGRCFYRHNNVYYVDEIRISEAISRDSCKTKLISKAEFLKNLSVFGKTLKDEHY